MLGYTFVLTALPPLSFSALPEISFQEVRELLDLNLSLADLKKVALLLQPIDLYNVRALWLGFPLDERGNLKEKDLQEALLVREGLPPYLIDFLEEHEGEAERLRFFSSLYVSLYRGEGRDLKGFLRRYFQFEREIRLVLTALRAKQKGKDLVRELQFEDPFDPFIAQILAQKDALDYAPPREYEDLKTLFVENSSEPAKLHRAFLEYQFRNIEEMGEGSPFTLDRVLNYVARFLLVEEYVHLDKEKGKAMVEELMQYG